MNDLEAALAAAFEDLQRGAPEAAEARVERWVHERSGDLRLAALRGQTLLALGKAEQAIPQLERALTASPLHTGLLTKLAFALIGTGNLGEAKRVALRSSAVQLQRVVAYVDHQEGSHASAIGRFRDVLSELPGDFESWNNLGRSLHVTGELEDAIAAFSQATLLAPYEAPLWINLSQSLALALRHHDRQSAMRRAVAVLPDNVLINIELGLAEGGVDNFDAAERAYRRALAIDPGNPAAYREFGVLLDRLSRVDDLDLLMNEAQLHGLRDDEIGIVRAMLLRRRGKPSEALVALNEARNDINPARLFELRGLINDALGNYEQAFVAFSEMNRVSSTEPAAQAAQAINFPGEVAKNVANLTAERVTAWRRSPPVGEFEPVFLLGFPRSGTTLLDTMLRGLPELMVLEEPPMLEEVQRSLTGVDLGQLSDKQIFGSRACYLRNLRIFAKEEVRDRTVVDKFPLHMVRVDLIHRLFPSAKIVFVERHPGDSLLSCFMARFVPNKAMVQFQDLESAARLFDVAFEAWTRARTLLPLDIHYVRYERMVADPESEMRPLLEFLGIEWNASVLDNQRNAAARRVVATASYAQVTQPINDRSVGRWRNYRKALEPVQPILKKWAEKMNYSL